MKIRWFHDYPIFKEDNHAWKTLFILKQDIQLRDMISCHSNEIQIFCNINKLYEPENNTNVLFHCIPIPLIIIWWSAYFKWNNCKTSYISCTLVGNKIVDHSDVVGASPTLHFHSRLNIWFQGIPQRQPQDSTIIFQALGFGDLILETWQ